MATVHFKGETVCLDPASGDEVYALARRRVDRDLAKGAVPSDEDIEGWLYMSLRADGVEAAVNRAVEKLLAEQRVYSAGDGESCQSVVKAKGLRTLHEHNDRKRAADPCCVPAKESFRWSVGQ